MVVKREEYEINGVSYEKLYIGTDEEHISGTIEQQIQEEIPFEPPIDMDEQLTELVINQEYTNCLLEIQMGL